MSNSGVRAEKPICINQCPTHMPTGKERDSRAPAPVCKHNTELQNEGVCHPHSLSFKPRKAQANIIG
eukprot:scaffold275626_cov24-Tisochrysis_lutea.AAC.1